MMPSLFSFICSCLPIQANRHFIHVEKRFKPIYWFMFTMCRTICFTSKKKLGPLFFVNLEHRWYLTLDWSFTVDILYGCKSQDVPKPKNKIKGWKNFWCQKSPVQLVTWFSNHGYCIQNVHILQKIHFVNTYKQKWIFDILWTDLRVDHNETLNIYV